MARNDDVDARLDAVRRGGLHVLRKPDAPWGDYGSTLLHGLGRWLSDGRFELERTGPFVPEVTFPGSGIVVTDAVKQKLEGTDLTGLSFRSVVKKRIVHLDWHLWDRQAREPNEYPAGGEPANYILRRKHSVEAADALGVLWAAAIDESPGLQVEGGMMVDPTKYDGQDICCASRWGYIYVSERMKSWLEKEVPDCVAFIQAPVAPPSPSSGARRQADG